MIPIAVSLLYLNDDCEAWFSFLGTGYCQKEFKPEK